MNAVPVLSVLLAGALAAADPVVPPAAPDELPDDLPVLESQACALCHSNSPRASAMRDMEDRPISPHRLWSGTMMANSSRDPLWRAAVAAEVRATPSRKAEIERKCLSCHAPMAHHAGVFDDHPSPMELLDDDSRVGELARDGVSCTICHGITPEGLGSDASFSGGYVLDDRRRLFGPHERPFVMPMRAHTGFTPTLGTHVLDAEHCGTCHTLETDALDPDGNDLGVRFLEQAPFLEWRNSWFAEQVDERGRKTRTCQACHVPTTDEDGSEIWARIARHPGGNDFPPTAARDPYGRHRFVGGNTLVLRMLKDHRDELRVWASDRVLDETIEATREQLRRETAAVSIEEVRRDGGALSFEVAVVNRTGHKLPTAHPTRRAWLRVEVKDADGAVVFRSGTTDAAGRIVGADGEPLRSERLDGPIEPHRDVIRSADEVQIWQAVMADADGAPTHVLLRGVEWLVDDRLLPSGWSPDHPDAARTAPVGVDGDDDFTGGSDRVRFEVEVAAEGPMSIEAALLFQPLSARWAEELFRWEDPAIERFRRMHDAADKAPEVLASARGRG